MFRQRAPRPDLSPLIDAAWTYRASAPGHLIVPADGCADLIWDGRTLHVGAPTVRPVEVPAAGGQGGLRLRPGALLALIADSRRPAADVLAERLDAAGTPRLLAGAPDALEALEGVLAQLVEAAPPPPPALALTRALVRPCADVDALARRLDMAPRTLRRHVGAALGTGPKQALRIQRVQRFLRLRERLPQLPLADLAAGLGYADQAHMTREVRALAGAPPGALSWSRSWPFCSRRAAPPAAG